MTEMNIAMIKVNKIIDNPNNPRKDLGDLTELADSIKQNGILQPLTVVEEAGKYKIIMGHRRFHAAEKAGLKDIPCRVVEMTDEDQKKAMLMENMQRQDLNVYEQAQGFQMMLDLGFNAKEISAKTGFSQKVVKERAAWAKLDQAVLQKKAESVQINFDQLNELVKVKNPELQAELMESLGTDDFDFDVSDAIRQERFEKHKNEWLKILEKNGATKINKAPYDKYLLCKSMSTYTDGIALKLELEKDKAYFYTVGDRNISVYTEIQKEEFVEEEEELTEEEKAINEAEAKIAELDRKAEDIREAMYNIRLKFIKNYEPKDSDLEMITGELVRAFVEEEYFEVNTEVLKDITGIDYDPNSDDIEEKYEHLQEMASKAPIIHLLMILFTRYSQGSTLTNVWGVIRSREYKKNESLADLYEFLGKLGYKMSTVEKKMMDGTHEIFKQYQEVVDSVKQYEEEEE